MMIEASGISRVLLLCPIPGRDHMTEKEEKKFYNSADWKHKRICILERDHYECQD